MQRWKAALAISGIGALTPGAFATEPVPGRATAPAPATTPTRMAPLPFQTPGEMRRHHEQQGLDHSVARRWNEVVLHAIRNDFARPTVHARNLYHTSAAMWDAWAAYDTGVSDPVLHQEKIVSETPDNDRETAISYAVYRIIEHRFAQSPGAPSIQAQAKILMADLGLDPEITTTLGDTPHALGNRIAQTYIDYGLSDGANEVDDYENILYFPVNLPLLMTDPGNPDLFFPNRWQPLALDTFIDQSGNPVPTGALEFLSPEWGNVSPFSLEEESDKQTLIRDFFPWNVWVDPGAPPTTDSDPARYKWGFMMVLTWSAHLAPTDGVLWDISPASIGNASLPALADEQAYYDWLEGGDWGQGWDLNPVTGEPYEAQIVPRGDYGRILAEFWADGPDSETPPGHWFAILNDVMDHPQFIRRFMGQGETLGALAYDVRAYLALGGAMHDAAVAAWSVKGYYDYIRPVSVIRWLAMNGQCSDPDLPSYSQDGIELVPGVVELITAQTTAQGERHAHLAGQEGKIAAYVWRGPDFIADPDTTEAGVGWILAENWWPYQRPSFVTPPFAGYVSGHSTYSRAAAELLTLLTGDPFFPGGMGEFAAPRNEFLVFEDGPSVDVTLQWATYRDASDQCSLSRIWGGIHPPADDIPGRRMGLYIGPKAFHHARRHFLGLISCPVDFNADGAASFPDLPAFLTLFAQGDMLADANSDDQVTFADIAAFLTAFGNGCP